MDCLKSCLDGLQRYVWSSTLKDSTWTSKEYEEYELEFKSYMQQNLQTLSPAEDFATEHRDDPEELQRKLQDLLELCKEANYIVVFTGAGISTSIGLPDYRGPQGVWTRKLKGELVSDDLGLERSAQLQPSRSHWAISRLHQNGFIKFVSSTNVDGLHLKSGLPKACLAELHGNSYVEECESCLKPFHRSFVTRTATGLFDHRTGRYCELCGGPLRDIIVNFGNTFEHVPSMEAQHDAAWLHCLKADLVLVLGSSLSILTACDLPEECLEARDGKPDGGKMVIVNLQRTPKDPLASLRIFAPCDEVMAFLEEALLGTER
ncbi:NAD-dependent protein deacetylase sirtuin-7 (NAD-dependent protein deacylase sirtuin-7) (Regulatory protein SIR2 homolog 7) (SIR2-like protein 7) [Durusdinium trenchii]